MFIRHQLQIYLIERHGNDSEYSGHTVILTSGVIPRGMARLWAYEVNSMMLNETVALGFDCGDCTLTLHRLSLCLCVAEIQGV